MSKQEEFYSKLKESLESQHKFPSKYLFKFIVPTANNQLDEVKEIFNLPGVVLNTKLSKTQKYVSASISMVASSADQIIAKYKEASKIDGIISL